VRRCAHLRDGLVERLAFGVEAGECAELAVPRDLRVEAVAVALAVERP